MIPNRLNSDNNNNPEMISLTFTSLVVAVVDKPFVTFVVITFECSIQVAPAAVTSAACNKYQNIPSKCIYGRHHGMVVWQFV